MLGFDSSSFAVAGAIAAAGPVLIHLLNRQRFKTVNWAAMDFLREAIQRSRRVLQIRDILLLALRMLSVVLIGFVLARPYLKGSMTAGLWQLAMLASCLLIAMVSLISWVTSTRKNGRRSFAMLSVFGLIMAAIPGYFAIGPTSAGDDSAVNSRTPVHAVLVIDNSRSLGVDTIGATLLDRAKEKSLEFIETLPLESRISVIPLAGSEEIFTLDAYRNQEDARRALERVKLVDTEGSIRVGLELADQACRESTDLPTKRVVLLTDAQANAWRADISPELLKSLSGLQVVNLTTAPAANIWVSGLHLEDGLVSAEVPCRILASLHSGAPGAETTGSALSEVQARLLIDEVEVDSQVVELSPGQDREIAFTYLFDQAIDPLHPASAVVSVRVQSTIASADRLPTDNQQRIVVPIVASFTVLFVDQYGDAENLEAGRIGETYALRHLMAPHSNSENSQRRFINVNHIRLEQLTQELLEPARLVVVAGIEKPDDSAVTLLRDYVRQGGPLVLLAGGRFDPAEWTEHGWQAGRGILPAPLNSKPFGFTPEESPRQLQPFHPDFATMQHGFFQIEGEDPKNLSLLFNSTPFFKAVQADLDPDVLNELLIADTQWFAEEQKRLDEAGISSNAAGQKPTAKPSTVNAERPDHELEKLWWSWKSPAPVIDRLTAPIDLARQCQPQVLASFDVRNLPFVIERRIGAGRVVFFTSGVTSNWNLLRSSGAMYLFHRTFYQLMEGTLPHRNFLAGQKMTIPVELHHAVRYSLIRPSGVQESLSVDPIPGNGVGVSIRRPFVAGTYTIQALRSDASATDSAARPQQEITLALNGAESESDLSVLSVNDLQQKLGEDNVRVLSSNEAIRLEGGARHGQDLWKALGSAVLGCLLIEKLILAWPVMMKR